MTAEFMELPGDDMLEAVPADLPARSMLSEMKGGPLVLLYKRLFHRLGITPRGVVHLGGHIGQEIVPYMLMGYERALFVEPDPRLFAKLQENLDFANGFSAFADTFVGASPAPWGHAIKTAVGDTNGVIRLHVQPAHTQENSILKPIAGSHEYLSAAAEEIEVTLRTLDSLLGELPYGWTAAHFNILYANIEGAELLALKGAEQTLKTMDFVFTEVNLKSHYEGNPSAAEIEEHLLGRGFALRFRCGGFLPDTGYMAFARS